MENKIHALREEGNLRVLPENKSEYKREFLFGTTSFLAMAYIIAVNPSILSASRNASRCYSNGNMYISSYWMFNNGVLC